MRMHIRLRNGFPSEIKVTYSYTLLNVHHVRVVATPNNRPDQTLLRVFWQTRLLRILHGPLVYARLQLRQGLPFGPSVVGMCTCLFDVDARAVLLLGYCGWRSWVERNDEIER